MSTVSRVMIVCGTCNNTGKAMWNAAHTPAELLKVPAGFSHVGRGASGEEYFVCNQCKRTSEQRFLLADRVRK